MRNSIKYKIYCNVCKCWSHAKCNFLSRQYVDKLCRNWHCISCDYVLFPFKDLTSAPGVPSNELQNCLNGLPSINCKYYDTNEFVVSSKSFKSNLSFFHLNIASLSLHFDSFKQLLSQLNFSFSLIGITETRFSQFHEVSESLPGFSLEHTPTESTAGGALLYISNTLIYRVRIDLSSCFYKARELESVFVEISCKPRSVIVGCIYRHPNMSISEFNESYLSPLLGKLGFEKKGLVFLGDFNINIMKSGVSSDETEFLDLMGSYLCFPFIDLPTRVTDRSSSLIDNIFVSNDLSNDMDNLSGNLTIAISDHMPQFVLLKGSDVNKNRPILSKIRDWSKFDKDKFIAEYNSYDWDSFVDNNDLNIDKSFDLVLNTLNILIAKHVPMKSLKNKKTCHLNKPWITNGIIVAIKRRNRLYKAFINCKEPSTKSIKFNEYKRLRNTIVNLIRISRNKITPITF